MVKTVKLLGCLSGGGPWGKNIGDRVGVPSSVVEGLTQDVGQALAVALFPFPWRWRP